MNFKLKYKLKDEYINSDILGVIYDFLLHIQKNDLFFHQQKLFDILIVLNKSKTQISRTDTASIFNFLFINKVLAFENNSSKVIEGSRYDEFLLDIKHFKDWSPTSNEI